MDFLHGIISFILHIDDHLDTFCKDYGMWTYGLLFLIVFCETGLVVTPFLPGDSLLFAVGALAQRGALDIWLSMALLFVAAFLGDMVNYWVGNKLGTRLSRKEHWFLKKKHLDRTHAFFEKHGGKAVVYARFVPIIRTIAPFVAGIGAMEFRRFVWYNIAGGLLWVLSMCGAGYFFGGLPFVRDHFEIVVLAIIAISLLPVVWEALQHYLQHRRERMAAGQPEAE